MTSSTEPYAQKMLSQYRAPAPLVRGRSEGVVSR